MHLGEDLFLKGVSQYLKAHAFANAETTDLWKALSDVSGQGISSMMSTWTKNVGHPVLTVTESGSTIHITQNRYLRNGPPTSEEDEVIWPVLLNFRTGEAHNNPRLMNSRSIEMALPTSDFYKLNAGHTGVYRVLYPPSRLAKLAESARTSRLSSADRSGLLFDAVSLTQSGHQTLIVTLDLAQALSDDSSSFVWQAQTKWYNALQSTFLFSDDRIKAGIIKLQRKVFAHKSRKLRPEVGSIRDVLDAQFKANVFLGAGLSGDRLTIASAKHMFHNGFAVGYRGAIKIDLRSAVFKVILNQQYEPDERNRSEYDYDVIVRELETGAKLAAERAAVTSTPSHACQRPRYYTGARTADERIAAASALGYAHSPALVQRSIALVLEKGRLNLDELHAVLSGLTTHVEGNMALLNTILTRFEEWKNRFGVGLGGLTFVLPILLGGFATYEHADQLGAFFRTQDVGGNGRELAQALEEIRIKAAWAERDGPALLAWLESNGFA
jgi:aminopeptidase 2